MAIAQAYFENFWNSAQKAPVTLIFLEVCNLAVKGCLFTREYFHTFRFQKNISMISQILRYIWQVLILNNLVSRFWFPFPIHEHFWRFENLLFVIVHVEF